MSSLALSVPSLLCTFISFLSVNFVFFIFLSIIPHITQIIFHPHRGQVLSEDKGGAGREWSVMQAVSHPTGLRVL